MSPTAKEYLPLPLTVAKGSSLIPFTVIEVTLLGTTTWKPISSPFASILPTPSRLNIGSKVPSLNIISFSDESVDAALLTIIVYVL